MFIILYGRRVRKNLTLLTLPRWLNSILQMPFNEGRKEEVQKQKERNCHMNFYQTVKFIISVGNTRKIKCVKKGSDSETESKPANSY